MQFGCYVSREELVGILCDVIVEYNLNCLVTYLGNIYEVLDRERMIDVLHDPECVSLSMREQELDNDVPIELYANRERWEGFAIIHMGGLRGDFISYSGVSADVRNMDEGIANPRKIFNKVKKELTKITPYSIPSREGDRYDPRLHVSEGAKQLMLSGIKIMPMNVYASEGDFTLKP